MRITCAVALAAACSSSSGTPDGAGGGDAGSPAGPTAVRVTLANVPPDPAASQFIVAYQDGDGPWQLAPAPTGSAYALTIASASYRFAYLCNANHEPTVALAQFTAAEKPDLTMVVDSACTPAVTQAMVQVTGTITETAATQSGEFTIQLGLQDGAAEAIAGSSVPYTAMVQPGTYDVIATFQAQVLGDVDLALTRRSVTIAADTTLDFDFTNAEPTRMVAADSLAATGSGATNTGESLLLTANGTTALLGYDKAAPFHFDALPADQAVASDLYEQDFRAGDGSASGETFIFAHTPAAVTGASPLPFAAVASVATTTPYPELAFAFDAYPDAIGYQLSAGQSQQPNVVEWHVYTGPEFAGASPQIRVPDLTSIPGWTAALQLGSGDIGGTIFAVTSSRGAADFPLAFQPAPDGTVQAVSYASFDVMP